MSARARHLRRSATDAERSFWGLVRRRQIDGCRFRRQHPIGPFTVDFVCLEKRLIVELDGAVHDHGQTIERDLHREAWLAAQGFKILRLSNSEANADRGSAVEKIRRYLRAKTNPPY